MSSPTNKTYCFFSLSSQAARTGSGSQQKKPLSPPSAQADNQLPSDQPLQLPQTGTGTALTPSQLPASSAQQQSSPRTAPPKAGGQPSQPATAALGTQGSAAAEGTQLGSAGQKKGSDSPPGSAGGPQAGQLGAGETGRPSKHVKMMTSVLEVLAREVLNPASTKETRDAAHTCLQVCWSELRSPGILLSGHASQLCLQKTAKQIAST